MQQPLYSIFSSCSVLLKIYFVEKSALHILIFVYVFRTVIIGKLVCAECFCMVNIVIFVI